MRTMEFRILGPLEVHGVSGAVSLGGGKPRAILALLLLHPNEPVSADRVAVELWGEDAPAGVVKRVHVHVSRLRKALGDGAILTTTPAGYRLRVRPGELDADRFERLVGDGRRAAEGGQPEDAADLLREALSLWRGPPLADLAFEPFAQAEIARLEEHHLAALEARVEADLNLGRHTAVVGELQRMVAANPTRERLAGQLMLALYRCGRQAEALAAYREARRVLVAEIGAEPGPELRRLHEAILGQDASLEPERAGLDLGRYSRPTLANGRAAPAVAHPTGELPAADAAALHGLPLPRSLRFAPASPFVGRDPEVARLHGLWANATGDARAVILAGEPGIGKTRLAGELARTVEQEGAIVLCGRCDDGLAVPYQPFVEALRPVVEAMGPGRLRAELGHLAPDLTRLWPELEALGEPFRTDPETGRYRLFEAVTALLEAATREQRALLVLEDLHWAAQPTLLMLRHLMRSERPVGALVVGTCRDCELAPDHPLPRLLADLQRDASVTNMRLGGLDERAIGALVEGAAGHALDERGRRFARMLQSETGGNPFFVREVLAHLVESGAVCRAGERSATDLPCGQLEVPDGLREVIRHRVARLSVPARRALAVAAVAGPRFSLALLEAVVGEQDGLLDGLDEAVAAGLLGETAPAEYAFAHALVRQTIYEDHSAARRMRLHRRIGEALEALAGDDADAEGLAHHFAEAAPDGQAAKAAAYALAAGRRAATRLAYEDAAGHFERGLQALERAGKPDDAPLGELLLALGDARWSSGEIDRAREACRLAAELAYDRGEPEQLARAALGFAGPARFEVAAAVTRPLIDLLERALAALGDRESALRARVMARLAAGLAFAGPHRSRPALARQALDIARRVGDNAALADVLASHHVATRGPNNFEERRAAHRELAHVAAEVGDGPRAALASSWILTDLLELGAVDEAERELRALVRLAEALQQRWPRFLATVARARRAHLEGRLEDYEALAHEALALALGREDEATHAFGAQMLFLRREQGRLDELVEAVESFADRYPDVPAWRCALAYTYAELDRRPDARRELDVLARAGFSDLPRDWLWLVSITHLSEVVAYLDDPARAELLHDLLLPYADRCVVIDAPFCQGAAARPLGLLTTTMGRLDAAARHFEDALAMNARIGSPLWVAHTRHDYAQTLLRRDDPGDREHALRLLEAALATSRELELTTLTNRAQRVKHEAQATRLRVGAFPDAT